MPRWGDGSSQVDGFGLRRGRFQRDQREDNGERAALPYAADKSDLTLHQGHQLLDDREAQPDPAGLASCRALILTEGLEDGLLGVGGYAAAGVGDFDAVMCLVPLLDAHFYTALAGVLESIPHQVHQDLLEALDVADQGVWQVWARPESPGCC